MTVRIERAAAIDQAEIADHRERGRSQQQSGPEIRYSVPRPN